METELKEHLIKVIQGILELFATENDTKWYKYLELAVKELIN